MNVYSEIGVCVNRNTGNQRRFSPKAHVRDFGKFAENPTFENHAPTPSQQGVSATLEDDRLVYGNPHASFDLPTDIHIDLPTPADIPHDGAYPVEPTEGRFLEVSRHQSCVSGELLYCVQPGIASLASEWFERQPKGTQRYLTSQRRKFQERQQKHIPWKRLPSKTSRAVILDHLFRSEGAAFTLNLTPAKAARILKSDRPAKRLADDINKAAKRILGYAPEISFAMEVSPTGKLHAHGIANFGPREGKLFAQALRSAGGKVHGCGVGRQTAIRRIFNATGWQAYVEKDFDRTIAALGTDRIIYISNSARSGARDEYEADLARQKQARITARSDSQSAKKPLASLTHTPAKEPRQRPAMSQTAPEASKGNGKSILTYCKYLKNNDKRRISRLTAIREYAMSSAVNTNHRENLNRMSQFILDNETYSRLLDALLAVAVDAGVARDADPFKIALGEIAGIWPETVLSSHPRRAALRILEAA